MVQEMRKKVAYALLVHYEVFDQSEGHYRPLTSREQVRLLPEDNLLRIARQDEHPEQLPGEIYLGSFEPSEIKSLFVLTSWQPRTGDKAYAKSGKVLYDHRPVFAKASDIFMMTEKISA